MCSRDGSFPSLTNTTVCENIPNQITGSYSDEDDNCISESCTTCVECPGDLGGDGDVGGADLTIVLNTWGCTGPSCLGDANGDEVVDGADLTVVLNAWGTCQ